MFVFKLKGYTKKFAFYFCSCYNMGMIRAIRGAICAENIENSILSRTKELLRELFCVNEIGIENVLAITFTCTKDLDAVYPAVAARSMGLVNASLMCTAEMDVKDAMQGLVRVQVLAETNTAQSDIKHIYLGKAKALRPDITKEV